MQLSVLIPAHNEESTLGAQLDALLDQDLDGEWEVLVIDNASSDGTAALVRRYADRSPRIRLVEAPERADRSYALNEGVNSARADAIAVCDADDIVADGWVKAMADALARHEVVTGPNELDLLNPPWLAASRGRSIEEPVGSFNGIFPKIRGNNWGVTRRAWSKVGGLTEGIGACEDAEFSYRCWSTGIEVTGVAEAVVHYRYRASPRTLWRQGFAYGVGRPHIARLLRDAGKPTPPPLGGWKSWAMLVLKLPAVVTRSGRATWVWIAANRVGQIVGSVRHRTLML